MKFKKVSQSDHACFYALAEEVTSAEYNHLVDWLDTHCPGSYKLDNMHVILERQNELFFELTFTTI